MCVERGSYMCVLRGREGEGDSSVCVFRGRKVGENCIC